MLLTGFIKKIRERQPDLKRNRSLTVRSISPLKRTAIIFTRVPMVNAGMKLKYVPGKYVE